MSNELRITADLIRPLMDYLDKVETKQWDDYHELTAVTISFGDEGVLNVRAHVTDERILPKEKT